MISVSIPGIGDRHFTDLVLDVNGTLTLDGVLLPRVEERIERLRSLLTLHLLSADTYGRLDAIAASLQIRATRLEAGSPEPDQKAAYVRQLGSSSVVAIGNGANDARMLREAALGIVVLGPEGMAVEAMGVADVVTDSISNALDLLLHPNRLVATLRR